MYPKVKMIGKNSWIDQTFQKGNKAMKAKQIMSGKINKMTKTMDKMKNMSKTCYSNLAI